MRRTYEANLSRSRNAAIQIRERFMDRPWETEESLSWAWPKRMKEVGTWRAGEGAIMYASNKWQKRRDQSIDYKHVAEGEQRLLVAEDFLRQYDHPSQRLPVDGPMVDVNGPMPDTFAKLAPILGIQAKLSDGNFYQIDIAHAELGAAVHPKTKKPFLFIYDKKGPRCIITGHELDVLKDGIVG